MSSSLVPALVPRSSGSSAHPANERSVYIETYGCQMNVYDTQVILDRLVASGFTRSSDHLTADLVLVNTCSVRDHAEQKVLSRLRELRRLRKEAGLPRALLGICGCMAERLQSELVTDEIGCDLVVGVDRYEELPAMIDALIAGRAQQDAPSSQARVAAGHDSSVHYVAPAELYPTNNSHLVAIHKGCNYRCSYCIVPYTRGQQSEKPPPVILDEIRAIEASGGAEVTLLGQNVTAYRWDERIDFGGLLELVLRETEIARVRFLTGHPCDMHERLMRFMGREPRICPSLHVPAQSGSDRVLQRMERRYTRSHYLDMVAEARRRIPEVTFSSDFIVGFPGESDGDFAQTLELIRSVEFDTVFAFKYSPRPGAPAAALDDDVPLERKKQRLAILLGLQSEIWERQAASQLGQTWHAVVEAPARRPSGHWRLRTPNNRKVVASLIGAEVGQARDIRITGWRGTTFLGVEAALTRIIAVGR